jgi:hypothetical protein
MVGLQPRLETDVHLLERPVDRFCFRVIIGYILSLSQNVRPAPLEVPAEDWIRRPAVTYDGSIEVLSEDFFGNVTAAAFADSIQRMQVGAERPEPDLLPIELVSCLVDVNHVGLLDLGTDLLVLAATGARSALGRAPRGRRRKLQSVELLETISDLPVGKSMLVLREGCLSDDVHSELSLVGTVGVRRDSFSATAIALVAVAVVLGSFWRLRVENLLDESGADALRLVKVLATLWTTVTSDLDFPVRIGSISEIWLVPRLASRRSTIGTGRTIVVLVIRGRLITARLLFAGRCMRSFVPPKLGSESLVFFFERGDPLKQFLHRIIGGGHRTGPPLEADNTRWSPRRRPSLREPRVVCCIDLRNQSGASYERVPKSFWG